MRFGAMTAAAIAAACTAGLAACGGTENGGTLAARDVDNGSIAKGRPGGHVRVLAAGDVDYLDPGQTYYAFGFMIAYATGRALYTYQPGDVERPSPDLATGPPVISGDRRTITVHLRPGVRFSPPVDREVTAADVEYAVERAFTRNVPSSYATLYFGDLVGAPRKPAATAADIPGVEAQGRRTVVFRLRRPTGPLVSAALALPITMPVPREYAAPFDAHNPSRYDQHVAFTGPYMVKADASGKLVGRKPGRSIELVRNPGWDPETDERPAYLDAITVEEGADDATIASRRILAGRGLLQGDGGPPAQIIRQAVRDTPGQITFVPGGSYRMMSLNTSIPPLDDLNVRKAILAAFDRRAMLLTRGGRLVGEVPTHFLPPGFPGYEEAGGARGPGVDFLRSPEGDLDLARAYLRRAGYASGRYDGGAKLLMVGSNADPGRRAAEVAQAQLAKLGFDVQLRLAPQDSLYTRFCNVPGAKVAFCPNVGFVKDFNDPQSLLDLVFNGRNILPVNNSNWSELDDPRINAAMAKAALLPPGPARNRAWGRIDAMIVRQAAAVPWAWDKQPLIASRDVQAVANEYNTSWDLSFSSRR